MANASSQWYYSVEGERFGPVGATELKRLVDAGEVSGNDLVFKDGMADWVPAKKVKGLISTPTPMPSASDEPPPLPLPAQRTRKSRPVDAERDASPPLSRNSRIVSLAGLGIAIYSLGILTGWAVTRQPKPTDSATPSKPVVAAAPALPAQFSDPRPADPPEREPVPPVSVVIDKPPAAQESIPAHTLLANFLGSNSGSRMAYGGKILEVSGRVADTRRDTANGVIVLLDGRNPFGKVVRCSVVASQHEKASKLTSGQSVVIRGRCDGHTPPTSGVPGDTVVDVLLNDCYVITP